MTLETSANALVFLFKSPLLLLHVLIVNKLVLINL